MKNTDSHNLLLGLLGVFTFSFSLPMTRLAAPELGGVFMGMARALVAATLAGGLLLYKREKLPARQHWRSLLIVASGVVVGFPVLSSVALQSVPSMHGTVINGLLPAFTALMAVFLAREKPPVVFWLWTLLGVAAVLVFAYLEGSGLPQWADLWMLLAVCFGGMGYAEGGRLSKELGGWRVICWALVFAAPFLLVPVGGMLSHGVHGSPKAWLGFAYVSVFSMFLGFFPWYTALARGGITRIAPIQMIQPALSLIFSALILSEALSPRVIFFGLAITAIAWFTRQAAQVKPTPSSLSQT